MPHYQHANGGRGHVFYRSVAALTFTNQFGDNIITNTLDLLNPMSDMVDLMDTLGLDGESINEASSCGCQ